MTWAGIDLGQDIKPTEFVGYTTNVCEAKVLAVCVGEELSGSITGGEKGIIVLDKTPFYAEMGGQVADHGVILVGDSRFVVNNVQKDKGGKYLHYGEMSSGTIKNEDIVCASIDVERRNAIKRAHSATHLLQKALTSVLGDHVHQQGSLVEPDRLRFDFTHYSAVTPEELARVDEIVPRRWVPLRCSAKSTVKLSVWLTWVAGPLSCAAVRIWTILPRLAPSVSRAKAPWLPVFAGSLPLPVRSALRIWLRTGN